MSTLALEASKQTLLMNVRNIRNIYICLYTYEGFNGNFPLDDSRKLFANTCYFTYIRSSSFLKLLKKILEHFGLKLRRNPMALCKSLSSFQDIL